MCRLNHLLFKKRPVHTPASPLVRRALDVPMRPGLRGWPMFLFTFVFALATAMQANPAAAAIVEGTALYRERIMPPADALLVVTVWDAARVDSAATELASIRQRLTGGPPFNWRLELDDRLVTASPAAVLRARIEVGGALWMTTDTVTPAFTAAQRVLVLRMVQAVPMPVPVPEPAPSPVPSTVPTPVPTPAPGALPRCADALTQAALNDCAYAEFLDASAELAAQLRRVESRLSPAQRSPWRKVQKAWLGFRTEACRFESAGSGGEADVASAKPMIQWLCSARMTRSRSFELIRSLACPEGDVSCVLRRKSGAES